MNEEELTPREMELALLSLGYDEEELEKWGNSAIQREYNRVILEIEDDE